MRNQNPETLSLQSKSKKTTGSAESEASFSTSKNNKSEAEAITTHKSRQPPLFSDAQTDGTVAAARSGEEGGGSCGRERLKRHWMEMAGRVWIPDIWGQEDLLKDWIDCSAFDSSLVASSIMSARESLVEEAQRASSTRIGIENSC